jgi:aconitate hydratase
MKLKNCSTKLICTHLVSGGMAPGDEISLKIDQSLAQDVTGIWVMLYLEALGLDHAKTDISVQYVDHDLLQINNWDADDHLFLQSACRRFGIWYSPPGVGVSHVVHMKHFGRPGQSLLGADIHTAAGGALGMLAIGAGGMDVAIAIAGSPFSTIMPAILGVKLTGQLSDWVSAKDVILEVLRRRGVSGGIGKIIEYYGPGLDCLSVMDRHVIANMGAELGATTTVFPSDAETHRYLRSVNRDADWQPLSADAGCSYDEHDEINLSTLEPLIALPTSPGNVVSVREVAGQEIYQSYIGSSANPGWRDFAIAAEIVRDRRIPAGVSFDINPTSAHLLSELSADGRLAVLVAAGARVHQAGCNGCIGMGQAPAAGKSSLRTTPQNFPGRSGTREDRVFLCSPETAAASAITGTITDPRSLSMNYPSLDRLDASPPGTAFSLIAAPASNRTRESKLPKGSNIRSLPDFGPLLDNATLSIALKVGDDLSTEEIMPADANITSFRADVLGIEQFSFERVDPYYFGRMRSLRRAAHMIVAGSNYGQGSSREHAAAGPRSLGLRMVLAKSFARIHRRNLINYGILPLIFVQPADYDCLSTGDVAVARELRKSLLTGDVIELIFGERLISTKHNLTSSQIAVILAGGLINWWREQRGADHG